jgi:TPP-dependent pyruvate/acetoin dehydrogenase alpha subunit
MKLNQHLNALANPNNFHGPIDISVEDIDLAVEFMAKMIEIRTVERMLAAARKDLLIRGPVHLGVGQEAIAVGLSAHLRKSDRVFGAHRSHSHILSLGSSPYRLFAEILGKRTGCSMGMGGSMHLWDKPNGFYGSVPIVSGTVPLAVGAGLAAKLQLSGDVAVAYLGDGAVEEGVVHESLNLAKVQNIPIIFVVENNLFASHMHISLRQPSDSTARFAQANDIPFRVVDGNDVFAVSEAAKGLIEGCRSGKGPGFIEAVTYRWYGHVDWREDIDVGVNRSQENIGQWRARDPVGRLKAGMILSGRWRERDQDQLESETINLLEIDWLKAVGDPYPDPKELLTGVYAK